MLRRLPWFVSAPAALASVAVMALVLNYALAPYFERSFLDEADPLAGVPQGSSSGDVARPATGAEADPPAVPVSGTPGVLAHGELMDGEPGHNGSGRVELIRAPGGGLPHQG